MAQSEIFLPFGNPVGDSVEITHGNLVTAVGNCTLVPGTVYYVINRPGGNLYVQAISDCTLAPTGFRGLLCPTVYDVMADSYGNNWIGVWRPELTDAEVAVNDLTIWGHQVWKNKTGNKGSKVDDYSLDSTNWQVIPRTSYTNHEYIELFFTITYDLANDWISKQQDGKSNTIGMDYSAIQLLGDPTHNPCDYTDWNMGTPNTAFTNNQVVQILNNFAPAGIYNNLGGPILNNRVGGPINQNISEWGIKGNSCAFQIEFNHALAIDNNSNNGVILGNISFTNAIENNANNGNISNNICSLITGNTVAVTDIRDNIIVGGIYSNSNTGIIANNANNGDIAYNSNKGDIKQNRNNGFIKTNSSSVTVHIMNNTNNGDITGARSANVTDTVVNK